MRVEAHAGREVFMGTQALGIGSTVFFVYGERVEEARIVSDTPRRWVATQGDSFWEWAFPKNGDDMREGRSRRGTRVRTRPVFITRESATEYIAAEQKASAERMWLHRHRWRVAHAVQYTATYEQVRQIAALVGYDDTKAGG